MCIQGWRDLRLLCRIEFLAQGVHGVEPSAASSQILVIILVWDRSDRSEQYVESTYVHIQANELFLSSLLGSESEKTRNIAKRCIDLCRVPTWPIRKLRLEAYEYTEFYRAM